jgi:integrase
MVVGEDGLGTRVDACRVPSGYPREVLMLAKITKRTVDAAKPEARRVYVWDTDTEGFGLVVYPNGKKAFVVRYRLRSGGHRRRKSLGLYGSVTAEEARGLALDALAIVRQGKDPLEEERERRAMPTFRGWVTEYLAAVQLRKKRPYHDRYHLQGPPGGHGFKAQSSPAMRRWANRPLDSITTREIQAWMEALAEQGKIHANRAYAALRACFERAVVTGILRENPCARVKKFPENPPRNRVLTEEEQIAIDGAIDTLPDPTVRSFFRLLRQTGCRKSEALAARWDDFDLGAGVWTIPSTKAGRPQSIPLPRRTVLMLASLPRRSEFVFPGRTKGTHLTDVSSAWEELKAAAKLDGVTLHDLRRTYGLAVAKTAGIFVASKLLRHHDPRITAKVYAPLGVEDLRKTAEDVGGGKVLPIHQRKRANNERT